MAARSSNSSTQEQQEVLQLLRQASHDYIGDTFKPGKKERRTKEKKERNQRKQCLIGQPF